MTHPRTPRIASGQVMVISLLVLGIVTLGFILISVASLDNASQTNLVLENKAVSSAAASGCMEQALDRLGQNAAYAGNETLSVASSTCNVLPVTSGSGTWTIETWSNVGDQYTRFRATLSSRTPITISSWTEVAQF